ncbi:MAG TPA: hypothetical protein VNO17_00305 [Actinomycetota bacterium]|nr:hypothetical protein [Actinomycetota bacterium]
MERAVALAVPGGLLRRLALSGLVAAVLAPLAVVQARAALEDLGRPRPGFVHAAAPAIEAVPGDGPLFSVPALAPGSEVRAVRLIRVRSEVPVRVVLHADVAGTGLARFLLLTVRRDGEVLYRGRLAGFPSSGLADPRPWRGTETHAFRFSLRLGADPDAAGRTARVDLSWEARQA